MKIQLNKIQHIGIPVSDLQRSTNFYTKLGFKNVMSDTFPYKNSSGKVAMLANGEIVMELYQLPEEDLENIKNRKSGNIDHVAFDILNVDETFDFLKNQGFEIEENAPVFLNFWTKGCLYFNVIGPDGERLEFNQIL